MVSPARGKYQARFHKDTSSNTAPCAAAQSCIGVLRIGSKSSPRAGPAKAPKVTGVVGRTEGREPHRRDRLLLDGRGDGERVHVGELALVGRHAGRGVALDVLDRAQALLDRELDVLDADVVLKVDESLDGSVAEHVQRRAERAAHGRGRAFDSVSAGAGRRGTRGLRRRAAGRVALGERRRRARTSRCRRRPSARAGPTPPGLKSCAASSKARRPRDWEKRWTDGVQPPDMRSASQAIRRMPPGCAESRTPMTRRRPSTSWTAALTATRSPAARAASGSGPAASSRRSAISSTATPASCKSSAAR